MYKYNSELIIKEVCHENFRLKGNDSKIPLGALPDIVFLLLIFFLITTTIDAEKGISLVLPPNNADTKPIPKDLLANILINASGQILVDREIVKIENLDEIIRNRLRKKPKLIVSLLTDRKTNYQVYIKVLDKLKQAWSNQPARISIAEPVEN